MDVEAMSTEALNGYIVMIEQVLSSSVLARTRDQYQPRLERAKNELRLRTEKEPAAAHERRSINITEPSAQKDT